MLNPSGFNANNGQASAEHFTVGDASLSINGQKRRGRLYTNTDSNSTYYGYRLWVDKTDKQLVLIDRQDGKGLVAEKHKRLT